MEIPADSNWLVFLGEGGEVINPGLYRIGTERVQVREQIVADLNAVLLELFWREHSLENTPPQCEHVNRAALAHKYVPARMGVTISSCALPSASTPVQTGRACKSRF